MGKREAIKYLISKMDSNSKVNSFIEDDKLIEACKILNLCVAANGCLFKNEKAGVFSELMKDKFNKRVEYKNKMMVAKKEYEYHKTPELEKSIAKYNNFQMAMKIMINSAYGAMANPWFRYFSEDYASAITLSGQYTIKWIERHVNDFLNEKLKTKNIDYVIASDTDSIYITLESYIKEFGVSTDETLKVVEFLDNAAKQDFEPFMKKCFEELAEYTNSNNHMKMKREVIADKAIWRAKKNYVANVLNSEGIQYEKPKLKIMGMEAVRSSTPTVCRDKIKETLELILTTDENTVIDHIAKFKKEFERMPIEDIAFPRGINGVSKYADRDSLYRKGTPIHVKGAIVYNKLLSEKKLTTKYPMIYDKDKIKFCYLKEPNPAFSSVISISKTLPTQLGLDKYIDYETQFQKAFLGPIKSILDVIGWHHEKRNTIDNYFE